MVVDGVLDETLELLDTWKKRLSISTVIHHEARGVAAALSAGFAAATGTYLLRCDDDLSVSTTFLSSHIAAHDGRRNRVVLSFTKDIFPPSKYATAYGIPANERGLAAYYQTPHDQRWLHVAACFSLHRDAWATSGGFDPTFAYGEDSEFGYRLWQNGAEFITDPKLEVLHRGPATSAATRIPRSFISGASRRRFYQVHPEAKPKPAHMSSPKAKIWRTMVTVLSRICRSISSYERLGGIVQSLVERVPAPIGGKLVALGVEAAAEAGLRYGVDDLHSYRNQKSKELDHELNRA